MLYISHDLAVTRRVADRTLAMYGGQILEGGPTEQLWNQPQQECTKALLAAIPAQG